MTDKIRYIATTTSKNIPSDLQIFMVDGAVPGWEPKEFDYHWNHHRPNGAEIQLDEMPFPEDDIPLIDSYAANAERYVEQGIRKVKKSISQAIVTTQIDADACCSAAWLQLPGQALNPSTRSNESKSPVECLRAIAYDCDHLAVSQELSHLADFAAQVVATLKQDGFQLVQALKLPRDRREWTEEQQVKYGSAAFERGTQWLIDAVLGKRPWPGEMGEAAQYWEEVEADKVMLFNTGRITILNGVILCDARGLGRIIDPRSFVRAIQEFILPKVDLEALRPEKLTIKDHGSSGHRYTLDCIPNHPKKPQVDYTAGTLERLSAAERKKAGDKDIDYSWGGRRTVAGSAWNAPSLLEPQEVIELL